MASAQTEPSMDEILASIRRIISEEDDAPAEVPVRRRLETLKLHDEADEEEQSASEPAAVSPPPAAAQEDDMPPAPPAVEEQAAGGEPAAQIREQARADDQPEPEAAAAPEAKQEAPADELDDFAPLPEDEPSSGSTMESAAVAHEQGEVHDSTYDEGPVEQPAAEARKDASRAAEALKPLTQAAAESMKSAISENSASKIASAFGTLEENVRISSSSSHTIEDMVQAMLAPMIDAWLDRNLPRIVEEKVEEEVRRIARRR
nr:DUF2497 domain-containing protein [Parvularcula oceani]